MDNPIDPNTTPTAQHITCEIDERGVATVTLNRPEVHNAFEYSPNLAITKQYALSYLLQPEKAFVLALI